VRASTGLAPLDAALGGLYWGDNVVWEVEPGADAEPFLRAAAGTVGDYDHAIHVAFSSAPEEVRRAYPGFDPIDARPGRPSASLPDLVGEIARRTSPARRELLVFDALDDAVAASGWRAVAGFFTRTCPMLLDVGAVAHWSVGRTEELGELRRAIRVVTQCVFVLRTGRLQIDKADARPASVLQAVFDVRAGDDGLPELAPAPASARLGAALRALRVERQLSQAELARIAGVTPSAISQAERGHRGLSLDTLLDLSDRLNISIDELLRGAPPSGYRLGRREDAFERLDPRPLPLLDDAGGGTRVRLVRLAPGESARPDIAHKGVELVLVGAGLVRVVLTTGAATLRAGETLLVDRSTITAWRNAGYGACWLFWVVHEPRAAGQA
jgi:transcriptional regulator with XRE-family HTH domain